MTEEKEIQRLNHEIADLRRQLAEAQRHIEEIEDVIGVHCDFHTLLQAISTVVRSNQECREALAEAQQARERAEKHAQVKVLSLNQMGAEREKLIAQLAAVNALLRRAEPYCKTASGHPYDEGLSADITAHLKPKP